MFKNQVLVLLGHNGAGKTTTISMITGLLEPTSGSAKVYGMDIFKERESVEQIIGICP
jgi:ATP-binding cassette subfamily A (ABC1) protein 3